MKKEYKILIFGVYGHGNIGDEAILQSMIDIFKKNFTCRIEVVGMERKYVEVFNKVKMVYPIPNTLKGIILKLLTGELIKTIKSLKNCDIFIMGGGGFLSDAYPDVPFGYLKHMFLAKIFRKKTMLYGIGAGQFLSLKSKFWTKYFINNYVDKVTVRDKISKEWLIKCGVIKDKILITGDQAINFTTFPLYNNMRVSLPKNKKNIVIIPIKYLKNKNEKKFFELKENFITYLKKLDALNNYNLFLVPFLETEDTEFCQELIKEAGIEATIYPIPGHHLLVGNVFKECDLIVSMRLHGNILAAANKKLFIPIIYHYKGYGFVDSFNWNYYSEFGEGKNWREVKLDVNKLYKDTLYLLENQKEKEKELQEKLKLYKEKEKFNLETLKNLLKK